MVIDLIFCKLPISLDEISSAAVSISLSPVNIIFWSALTGSSVTAPPLTVLTKSISLPEIRISPLPEAPFASIVLATTLVAALRIILPPVPLSFEEFKVPKLPIAPLVLVNFISPPFVLIDALPLTEISPPANKTTFRGLEESLIISEFTTILLAASNFRVALLPDVLLIGRSTVILPS